MSPRKSTKAKCKEPTPPRWTVADGLEEELRSAEDVARGVLAKHAGKRTEAFARFDSSQQENYRLFAALGAMQFLEHTEPVPPKSKQTLPRPCERCEAAQWLLLWAGELRLALANAAPEAAVGYALTVGRLQVQLGLTYAEGVASHHRQTSNARRDRGPCAEERKRRDEQIRAWNAEYIAKSESGRPPRRPRLEYVRLRCKKTHADLSNIARGRASRELAHAAEVWNIGIDSIIKAISSKKNN